MPSSDRPGTVLPIPERPRTGESRELMRTIPYDSGAIFSGHVLSASVPSRHVAHREMHR